MKWSKARNSSSLAMGRHVFSHVQETRAPTHLTVSWEDKCHHSCCMPLFVLSPTLYAEHDVPRSGIPLWSVGATCSSCVPSQLLVHTWPPLWLGGVRGDHQHIYWRGLAQILSLQESHQWLCTNWMHNSSLPLSGLSHPVIFNAATVSPFQAMGCQLL